MGKAKQGSKDKTYTLTDKEFNYLKILNLALQYNTLRDKCISGFLYYVCSQRFGFKEDQNLQFEIDLDKEKGELKVTEIPTEEIKKAIERG